MRARKLIAAVAGGAVAIVALTMLGPGRARPVQGAQLWGGALSEGSGETSVRVVVLERQQGFERKLGGWALSVEGETPKGARAHWRGATGPDGTVEATLRWERQTEGPFTIRVRDAEGGLLAEGNLPAHPADWGPGEAFAAELRGHRAGTLTIRAATLRGVLASPFREEAVVEVLHNGAPAAHARIKATAVGAMLDRGRGESHPPAPSVELVADDEGRARFGMTPVAHAAEFEIEASWRGDAGRFEGRLPIMPGAIWLEPAAPEATSRRLVSPVPREVAYVSVATPRARIFGAAVPLTPTEDGYAAGSLDLSALPPALGDEGPVVVTVASSLRFDGAATVGWPLSPPPDPFAGVWQPIADAVLLDGMPRAEAADRERRKHAAWSSLAVLALATFAEAFLLVRAARMGKMAAASDGMTAGITLASRDGSLRLLLAIALALLTFAGVGIVAIWLSAG